MLVASSKLWAISHQNLLPMPTPRYQSHLIIHSFADGNSYEIYSADGVFEAPNWRPDREALIINRDGGLLELALGADWRAPLPAESAVALATGGAERLNNDHGLSPDGALLAISHHSDDADGASVISVLPSGGGEPRRITPAAPSYWHGWSPDGRTLAYVAGRPGNSAYKIYTIDLEGGPERQLTFGDGLDDGPDYSHDGAHIYFNAFRNGAMRIWRMSATGEHPLQVTEGPGSDWFAHPDPTGTRVIFLRYLEDQGAAHPFGRQVQIMNIDLASGAVTPITEPFFGGQGTLNVPAYRRDGGAFAYVRYSELGAVGN